MMILCRGAEVCLATRTRRQLSEVMACMDEDGDGTVDMPEFKKWWFLTGLAVNPIQLDLWAQD